jgi:erythrin-vacuolar iron transport family protein
MPPPAINFASLSLVDALDLAILIEDEARDRYGELADQMELHHTPEAALFFRQMAVNETRHGTELAMRRQALFPTAARTVTREMLWDVEAPGYESVTVFMSVRQAMVVALEAEIKAHDYFAAALEYVFDPDVKALFVELRNEEIEHQEMVRRGMAKLPPGPEANPDDFADEPVAL